MIKKSAGILLYRNKNILEVLLAHPGGPFYAKKDLGHWSVPKGEFTDEEDSLTAAKREFMEETGIILSGTFTELTPIVQKGGKQVFCYACEGDLDPKEIISNFFEMEWPPKSGKKQSFPEIDRCEWVNIEDAKIKILEAQKAFIDELVAKLKKT